MLSVEHEVIVDDVREALNKLRRSYPNLTGPRGFSIFIEACVANIFLGMTGKGRRGIAADAYIIPGDGGGPIMVEVGQMKEGKWNYTAATDGSPVRVLRVDFDRMVYLIRPRHTKFELEMMKVLERTLTRSHSAKQSPRRKK